MKPQKGEKSGFPIAFSFCFDNNKDRYKIAVQTPGGSWRKVADYYPEWIHGIDNIRWEPDQMNLNIVRDVLAAIEKKKNQG